jgi:hypothetical protein
METEANGRPSLCAGWCARQLVNATSTSTKASCPASQRMAARQEQSRNAVVAPRGLRGEVNIGTYRESQRRNAPFSVAKDQRSKLAEGTQVSGVGSSSPVRRGEDGAKGSENARERVVAIACRIGVSEARKHVSEAGGLTTEQNREEAIKM